MRQAPMSNRELADTVGSSMTKGSDGGLRKALGKKGLAINYVIEDSDTVVTLSGTGTDIQADGVVPSRRGRVLTVAMDRETSHRIMSREITFMRARSEGKLKVSGAGEEMGWLLAYLSPIFQEYEASLKRA